MDTEDLNNTISQLDLADIYKIIHAKRAKYTFLSIVHEREVLLYLYTENYRNTLKRN